MIHNYNEELLWALHSIFWYDGLLDQEDDKWVDYTTRDGETYSRPKYTEDSLIIKLINELREKQTTYPYYTLEDISKLCKEFQSPGSFNVIWMLLVEMFGNCGTSPRTGWIEKRKECAEFLEQIVYIEDLTYKA